MSNILERRASLGASFPSSYNLNSSQIEQDQLLQNFSESASDWRSLVAMTLGGLAYRVTKLGVMSVGAIHELPLLARLSAPVLGLASEVTVFRTVGATLASPSLSGAQQAAPLLDSKSWFTDFINFASLKVFGRISQGQNSIFSHVLQDMGMVTGHHLAYGLNLVTQPEGSLAQQLAHAEITNLQMQAGMALGGALTENRLQRWERNLDLQIHELSFLHSRLSSSFLGETSTFRNSISHMMAESSSNKTSKIFWAPREKLSPLSEPRSMRSVWKALNASFQGARRLFEGFVSPGQVQEITPDARAVHEVWFHQMKDFVRSVGGTWRLSSSHCLLEPMLPHETKIKSGVLEKSLSRLRERGFIEIADQVLEFEIPYEEVRFGLQGVEGHNTELSYILNAMEGDLQNTVRLVGNPRTQGKIVVRMPSLLLLESLQESISQERFTPFVYVNGRISRDFTTKIRSQAYAPIALSRSAPFLGDIEAKVHPWFFTLHDVYHALGLSEYAPPFRAFVGQHYERLQNTALFKSPFIEKHLDRLVDFDPAIDREGKITNYLGYSVKYVWEMIFEGDPDPATFMWRLMKQRRFWTSYLNWMEASMPIHLQQVHYHEDLRTELQKLVGQLNELLTQSVKAIRKDLQGR